MSRIIPLMRSCSLSGDAQPDQDFAPGTATIPEGRRFALVRIQALATALNNRTMELNLKPRQSGVHSGCPSASLVIIRHMSRRVHAADSNANNIGWSSGRTSAASSIIGKFEISASIIGCLKSSDDPTW